MASGRAVQTVGSVIYSYTHNSLWFLDKISSTTVSGVNRTASGALCELVHELQFGIRYFQNGRHLHRTRVSVIYWTVLRLGPINSVMCRTLNLNFTHVGHYMWAVQT